MKKICVLSMLLIACCSFTGCTGVKNSMRLSEKNSQWNPISKLAESRQKKAGNRETQPESMAVIWKDSVLEKPGTKPVKGFGGRIFFYDENSNAVKADGDLIVYGYDDSIKDKISSEADRNYVFKSDRFQTHFSETELGGSYSVWVPWEPVGGDRKTITLIPVFKTADGRVLKSGQSINVLPGKTPEVPSSFAISSGSKKKKAKVALAAFDTENSEGEVATADLEEDDTVYNRTRIKTSTIQVTPTLARKLSNPVSPEFAKEKRDERLKNAILRKELLVKELARRAANRDARVDPTTPAAASTLAKPGFGQPKPKDGSAESAQSSVFGSPGFFGNRK